MELQWRDFRLVVTLAGAAYTPASAQNVAPAHRWADRGAMSGASIQEYSGIGGNPYLYGIEPPVRGPGPIVNKSRRRQIVNADGLGLSAASAPLVSEPRQLVGDYTNPILKPWAAEVVKKFGEISLTFV